MEYSFISSLSDFSNSFNTPSSYSLSSPSPSPSPSLPTSSLSFNSVNDNIVSSFKWKNTSNKNYFFQSSIEKVKQLIQTFGTPNYYNSNTGGYAKWVNADFYSSIEIHDRILINKWPKPHNSILTLYFICKLQRKDWNKIQDISSDILYDFITNKLIIRCPTLSYGNALFAVIIEYITGKVSWNSMSNSYLIKNRLLKTRLSDEKFQQKDINTIKMFYKK